MLENTDWSSVFRSTFPSVYRGRGTTLGIFGFVGHFMGVEQIPVLYPVTRTLHLTG
jgi:hypothetical protein